MRAGIAATADMGAYLTRTHALLGTLAGTVLEIGAGYGANFSLLPADIDWLGLEPDPNRGRRLARVAAAHGHHAPVIAAPAERIPLGHASVDAVVSTHVLCSVADQHQVLAEIGRVVRPGGAFVFAEHVAAPPGTWSRRLQRCWAPISRRQDGCDPGRDTWRAIQAAGFGQVDARWFTDRTIFGLSTPFIAGAAHTRLVRSPNRADVGTRPGPHRPDEWEEVPMRALRMSRPDQGA